MGIFSFITLDTNRSISLGSSDPNDGIPNQFTVYMIAPDGRIFKENNYEGYGIFGGQDIFDLYDDSGQVKLYPILVEDSEFAKGKGPEIFKTKPKDCPWQGCYYPLSAVIKTLSNKHDLELSDKAIEILAKYIE